MVDNFINFIAMDVDCSGKAVEITPFYLREIVNGHSSESRSKTIILQTITLDRFGCVTVVSFTIRQIFTVLVWSSVRSMTSILSPSRFLQAIVLCGTLLFDECGTSSSPYEIVYYLKF